MKSPSKFFLIVYIIIIAFSIATESDFSENIIDTNGKILVYSLILLLLEIPLIYFLVWKMTLKSIVENMTDDDNEKKCCSFFSFLALPIIFTSLNMIAIESINESWNKSRPVKRYLKVTHTYSKAMHRSNDRRTDRHYMELTSWVSKKSFTVRITKKEHQNTKVNDVYEAITKSGYFGLNYYTDLHKIDESIFPPDTKFPIDEAQAARLIEEKELEL